MQILQLWYSQVGQWAVNHNKKFSTQKLFYVILENMSSEKVVQEDLRKSLQKAPAAYHLYIFLQLDDHFWWLVHRFIQEITLVLSY